MENSSQTAIKKRGRPSHFDANTALEQALIVFWTYGYEGTSMAELTEALGMNKPSIYAAFGNKQALFKKVLDKYTNEFTTFVAEAMREPTAAQAIHGFLSQAAVFLTNPKTPHGCMIIQGALTCSSDASAIKALLIDYRKNLERTLTLRFEQAKTQGDLPNDCNSQDLARYVLTLHQGMSVQATSGASLAELTAVIDLAMSASYLRSMR
ncbi:MAG TPA: TetR/AcrR family transcriptional regulator [Methylophilus sp.]